MSESNTLHTYNIDYEKKILGLILLDFNQFDNIIEIIQKDHFYENIHKEIFMTFLQIKEKNLTPTKDLVVNILSINKNFDEKELNQYIDQIMLLAQSVVNPVPYCEIVRDLFLRRQLIDFANKVKDNAQNSSLEKRANDQLNSAEEILYNIAMQESASFQFEHISQTLPDYLKSLNQSRKLTDTFIGLPCNILDLDNALGGFRKSDLIIIAGRPGMGKTAFALTLALGVAKNLQKDESVGIFSLEMSKEQLCSRLLSIESGISSSNISNCDLSDEQFNVLLSTSEELNNVSIFIDDSAALSISAIRSRARRIARKENIKFLIIDYLQLLYADGKNDNRVLEISKITQGLKQIAKELNIPVIALSQLSRSVESRTNNRPILSDLRESGSIEQDADIVMFLYREEYYLKLRNKELINAESEISAEKLQDLEEKSSQCRNIAEIIIAKHRNGATQNIHLYHDPSTFTFKNLNEQKKFR